MHRKWIGRGIWMVLATVWLLGSLTAWSASRVLVVNLMHVSSEISAEIVDSFEAQHPGLKVEVVGKETEQILARVIAGEQIDVMQMDLSTAYMDFVRRGLIQDLTKYVARNPEMTRGWAPPIMEMQRIGGKDYLIPRGDVGAYMLWTNIGMIEQAGAVSPPLDWTHDDFIRLSRKLRKDINGDGNIDQWLYSWESLWAWKPWYTNRGGTFAGPGDPAQPSMIGNESVEALQWMADMRSSGFIPTRGELGSVKDAREAYLKGSLAMAQAEPRKMVDLAINANIDAGVTLEPAGPAGQSMMLTWQGFAVSATTKQPDLAFDFIRHVVSPQYQKEWIVQKFSPTVSAYLNREFFGTNVRIPGFHDAFLAYFTRPQIPANPLIPADIASLFEKKVVEPVLRLKKPARQAVEEYSEPLQQLWARY